jgi:hypothetical protein
MSEQKGFKRIHEDIQKFKDKNKALKESIDLLVKNLKSVEANIEYLGLGQMTQNHGKIQ